MSTNAINMQSNLGYSFQPVRPSSNLSRAQRYSSSDNYYFMKDLEYSMGPFHYMTDPNRNWPLTNCEQYVPFVGNLRSWGVDRSMIHTESDLRNQIRPASKVPSRKYHPNDDYKVIEGFGNNQPFLHGRQTAPGRKVGKYASSPSVNCVGCPNCNLGLPCECQHCQKVRKGTNRGECRNQIIPIQTRSLGKACNLPGVFINRFEDTCFDHQNLSSIHSNWYIGMDTRNDIKDAMSQYDFPKIAKVAKMPRNKKCYVGGKYKKLGCKNYPQDPANYWL